MPSPRAQRFGLLPIARKTGGLADSIEDSLTESLFRAMSVDGCLEAVVRALNVFGNSEIFVAMRQLAMAQNVSWSKLAAAYQALYARALEGFRPHRVA